MSRNYRPTELLTYNTDAELWAELADALTRSPFCLHVTHVAKSGMSRRIRVLGVNASGIVDLTRHVARLTGKTVNRDDLALNISGCGMDMGFALMESLGAAWADAIGIDRPYRFGGLMANNGTAWDSDKGTIENSTPWPTVTREDGRTRGNWRWL